jgi:hypothetical protein
MDARRSSLRFWLLLTAAVVVLLLGLLVFAYMQMMGLGGWEPDANSSYAKRARLIDSELKIGMPRDAVTAIFHKDALEHHGDSWKNTTHAHWGNGVSGWADEADLYIFEPRPHFWNSFDTMWTVRAGFDKRGRLIHRTVHLGDCCGP